MSYEKAREALDKAWSLAGPSADNYTRVNGLPDYKIEVVKLLMDLADMEIMLQQAIDNQPGLHRLPRFPDIEPEDVPLPY